MKKNEFIQKGEQDFIDAVVQAILKNDASKQHYLIEDRGIIHYVAFPIEERVGDIVRSDGTSVKALCIFGKELIKDFHLKAGNDDLSKPWARKAVKYVISIGKKKAEEVYK
jgi:hypothetical protein